jgi:hypothetical protein
MTTMNPAVTSVRSYRPSQLTKSGKPSELFRTPSRLRTELVPCCHRKRMAREASERRPAMNRFQNSRTFPNSMTTQAVFSMDFRIVCLWSTVGLVLTALTFTLGFSAEVSQALALAG